LSDPVREGIGEERDESMVGRMCETGEFYLLNQEWKSEQVTADESGDL